MSEFFDPTKSVFQLLEGCSNPPPPPLFRNSEIEILKEDAGVTLIQPRIRSLSGPNPVLFHNRVMELPAPSRWEENSSSNQVQPSKASSHEMSSRSISRSASPSISNFSEHGKSRSRSRSITPPLARSSHRLPDRRKAPPAPDISGRRGRGRGGNNKQIWWGNRGKPYRRGRSSVTGAQRYQPFYREERRGYGPSNRSPSCDRESSHTLPLQRRTARRESRSRSSSRSTSPDSDNASTEVKGPVKSEPEGSKIAASSVVKQSLQGLFQAATQLSINVGERDDYLSSIFDGVTTVLKRTMVDGKIGEIKKENAELRREIETTKLKNAELHQENEKITEKSVEYFEEIEKAKIRIGELEMSNNALTLERETFCKGWQKTKEELVDHQNNSRKQLMELQNDCERLTEKLSISQQECDRLAEIGREQTNVVLSLKNDLLIKEEDVRILKDKNEKFNQRLQEKNTRLFKCETAYNHSKGKVEMRDTEIRELKTEIEKLKTEVHNLKNELEVKGKDQENDAKEFAKLKQQLHDMVKSHEEFKTLSQIKKEDSENDPTKDITAEGKKKDELINDLRKDLNAKIQEIGSLKQRLETIEAAVKGSEKKQSPIPFKDVIYSHFSKKAIDVNQKKAEEHVGGSSTTDSVRNKRKITLTPEGRQQVTGTACDTNDSPTLSISSASTCSSSSVGNNAKRSKGSEIDTDDESPKLEEQQNAPSSNVMNKASSQSQSNQVVAVTEKLVPREDTNKGETSLVNNQPDEEEIQIISVSLIPRVANNNSVNPEAPAMMGEGNGRKSSNEVAQQVLSSSKDQKQQPTTSINNSTKKNSKNSAAPKTVVGNHPISVVDKFRRKVTRQTPMQGISQGIPACFNNMMWAQAGPLGKQIGTVMPVPVRQTMKLPSGYAPPPPRITQQPIVRNVAQSTIHQMTPSLGSHRCQYCSATFSTLEAINQHLLSCSLSPDPRARKKSRNNNSAAPK